MKNYRVTFYAPGVDTPSAEAFVTAESPDEAHNKAIGTIRRQLPGADLEMFDQYSVIDIIWKTPPEGEPEPESDPARSG